MASPRTSAERARQVFDAMTREIYYGLNLMFILSEASAEECKTIVRLMNRAREARSAAVARVSEKEGAR